MLALLLLVGGVIWNQEDWDDLLSDERATYYGLMDQDKLVGNVFTYNWKGEMDYIKIMNLSVHPDYRGNGYAHNLMALVKEELESSQLKIRCGYLNEPRHFKRTLLFSLYNRFYCTKLCQPQCSLVLYGKKHYIFCGLRNKFL